MPGKYPNGGYRNTLAAELSMPPKSSPPTVTAPPVGASGNSYRPPIVEILPPTKSGGDLRGKVTPGLGSTTGKGTRVLDLQRLQNYPGVENLPWQVRDKLKGWRTIELDPQKYRVNGRGYIARMALKLARDVLGVSRKLPKHLLKALIEMLADLLLQQLEETITRKETTTYGPGQGWIFRSYGTAGGEGISANEKGLQVAEGAVDLATINGRANTEANGQVMLAYTTYDPKNYGRGPEPAYGAPISGQAISRTNSILRFGVWAQMSSVGPTLAHKRFAHIASYFAPAEANATRMLELRTSVALQTGPLNAPFPNIKGPNPPPRTTPANPFKVADRKYRMNTWLNLAYMATEFADVVDCMFDALPAHKRYGRDYTDKMERIYESFDGIDWGKALSCFAYNHYEDKVIGTVQRYIGKARRQNGKGVSYQWGDAFDTGISVEITDVP